MSERNPIRMKAALLRSVTAAIARSTGRLYQIELDALDERSLRELWRLLRDLDDAKHDAVRRAKMMPWRRMT